MSNYIQIEFTAITSDQSELLIAELNFAGYEGFEEGGNSLKAYIKVGEFDENALAEIADRTGCKFTKTVIEETNWNALWESNFQPVIAGDFVAIRADFHKPIEGVEHEIIITPKMSFGTGHHATTYMMIHQMRKIEFDGKTVFDFGTGTGVLAILAEKMGASSITAIDNDDWSIENTIENTGKNNCILVQTIKADSVLLDKTFDIILANINKNVILDNLQALKKHLRPNGMLLISGLLKEDEAGIITETNSHFLQLIDKQEQNNWICLLFKN